jgi:hypothetical protein
MLKQLTQSDPKENGTRRSLRHIFTVYFSTVGKQTNNINLYFWFTFLTAMKGLLESGSFIHSFILHSVNPYKVRQPKGYRTCHIANAI